MSVEAIVSIPFATALIKRTLDEVFAFSKEALPGQIAKLRASPQDADVAAALLDVTRVKTLWQFDRAVSLYEFYYPSRIAPTTNPFGSTAPREIVRLKEFGGNSVLIQGTAGQGKSIFLRYMCGQELRTDDGSNRVPIFCELRRLRKDFPLSELILHCLAKFKLPSTEAAWKVLAKSGRFAVLLDGFDEVETDLKKRTLEEIEALIDLYRNQLQVVVTSRVDSGIERSERLRVYRLAPLDPSDHYPFLRQLTGDEAKARSLQKAILSSPTDLGGVLTTPLMLTLLELLYRSTNIIPQTVPRFYDELFDTLFFRHDGSKPTYKRQRLTSLTDTELKELFSAFCYYARVKELNQMTNSEFVACTALAERACAKSVDPHAFLNELTQTVCLLLQEGLHMFFIHLSVAQYYAASFIRANDDESAESFYRDADHDGWHLELRFLSEIDEFRYNKFYLLPRYLDQARILSIDINKESSDDADKLLKYLLTNVAVRKTLGDQFTWEPAEGADIEIIALAKTWLNDSMVDLRGISQERLALGVADPASLQMRLRDNNGIVLLGAVQSELSETALGAVHVVMTELRTKFIKLTNVLEARRFRNASLTSLPLRRRRTTRGD